MASDRLREVPFSDLPVGAEFLLGVWKGRKTEPTMMPSGTWYNHNHSGGSDWLDPRTPVVPIVAEPEPEPSPRELAIRELEALRRSITTMRSGGFHADRFNDGMDYCKRFSIDEIDARLAKLREVRP